MPKKIRKNEIKQFVINNFNGLLSGHHGVGKTAIITQVFDELGLNWRYFSAATIDPWVDFVGVPKAIEDDNGRHVLDLIRPKDFEDDNVEALFFDEFNRAPSKVKNAVMELIQFGSINGRKFSNLKVIWVAINPDNGSYDVDSLDPAQLDRFPVQIEVPFDVDKSYLKTKYKNNHVVNAFYEWWNELPKNIKEDVSPRRLDNAIDAYLKGLELRYFLPQKANVDKLIKKINDNILEDKIKKAYNDQSIIKDGNFISELRNSLDNGNTTKDMKEEIKTFIKDMSDHVPHDWFKDILPQSDYRNHSKKSNNEKDNNEKDNNGSIQDPSVFRYKSKTFQMRKNHVINNPSDKNLVAKIFKKTNSRNKKQFVSDVYSVLNTIKDTKWQGKGSIDDMIKDNEFMMRFWHDGMENFNNEFFDIIEGITRSTHRTFEDIMYYNTYQIILLSLANFCKLISQNKANYSYIDHDRHSDIKLVINKIHRNPRIDKNVENSIKLD